MRVRYDRARADCPRREGERPDQVRRRETGWLTLTHLLPALLEQADRMGAAAGVELRLPFCDPRLVEYVWNIPWWMKTMNGRQEQALRDAAAALLPRPLLDRPPAPGPRMPGTLYGQLVRAKLARVLDDPGAPLHGLADAAALRSGLLDWPEGWSRPWLGGEMAGPQLMAYLVQVNSWMERFHLSV